MANWLEEQGKRSVHINSGSGFDEFLAFDLLFTLKRGAKWTVHFVSPGLGNISEY